MTDIKYRVLIFIILSINLFYSAHCQQSKNRIFQGWQKYFEPIKFGSNKPHLMFSIGSRDVLSYNIGYGYWLAKSQQSLQQSSLQGSKTSMYSDLRYKYQNTEQQLYINVLNHDGEKIIWQEIKDNRYKIESDVKYNYLKSESQNQFQFKIDLKQFNNDYDIQEQDIFKNPKVRQKGSETLKQFQKGDLLWFVNMAIQNNDLRLINHKDYLSPVSFKLQKTSKSEIKVNIQQLKLQKNGKYEFSTRQTISFKGKHLKDLNMFGFTVNISQSYQSFNYLNQFKYLLELQKYPHLNIPRKNDSKLIEWENKQIQQIKKGKFQNQYTYVIIYGSVQRQALLQSKQTHNYPYIYVTNSSKKQKAFQSKTFDILTFQNQISLFKQNIDKLQNQEYKKFVKHVIFNLLGGITYYEGKLYTQNSIMSHQHDYSFTFTPSRLIFPRSFLWDDGFHNAIIAKHKPQLTLQMLHSWFKKVDLFGWIGRQQIRGFQISSMMPDNRFIYQDVFQLNPPTFVIPLLRLIQNEHDLSPQVGHKLQAFLHNHYDSLQKHFRYFLKTQSHYDLAYKQDLLTTIKYRWRCKDQCAKGNFMGSGLDDYPRVENKTQISKQHIDLSSWLWFFSDALQQIGTFVGKSKAASYYKKWKDNLRQKIIEQCLDQTDMLFKDLAVKGDKLFIDQKITKIGYINLYPFFVGLLQLQDNQSPQRAEKLLKVLDKTIEVMMDQDLLMSPGGIRSLSLKDSDYASQENYWRGAVWMPINYMILRACKKYYWNIQSQVHRQKVHALYKELRERLINTVYKNYKKSGYLYQNYIQGEGNRGYPFYGWTSLIASIMLQDY